MMRPIFAASLLALAVAAPAAAQSGTFSLPPNPTPTATGNPNVQGPVDPDKPFATRPRDTTARPTPTPRATASSEPEPVRTPAPAATRTPRPRAAPTRPPTSASEAPRPLPTPPQVATPAPTYNPFPSAEPVVTPSATPTPFASAASPAPVEPEEPGLPWGWITLGVLAALAAAGAAGYFFLRRREEAWDEPGAIEPPLARQPAPQPPAADGAPAPVVPLMVEAQALKLSRSIMYATLSYELRLANRGRAALNNVRLGGDLVTAHGRVPVDQQLADPALPLEIIQQVASLGPGESTVLTGEIRLPVRQIRPIPQGRAILFVPLLRLRIEADGLAPFARTFVVGKRPAAPGGRLQPFRLDETPQTYRAIAQRALD